MYQFVSIVVCLLGLILSVSTALLSAGALGRDGKRLMGLYLAAAILTGAAMVRNLLFSAVGPYACSDLSVPMLTAAGVLAAVQGFLTVDLILRRAKHRKVR